MLKNLKCVQSSGKYTNFARSHLKMVILFNSRVKKKTPFIARHSIVRNRDIGTKTSAKALCSGNCGGILLIRL